MWISSTKYFCPQKKHINKARLLIENDTLDNCLRHRFESSFQQTQEDQGLKDTRAVKMRHERLSADFFCWGNML